MNVPVVTVIVPMRNGEPFVRETLATLLASRGVDLEIVVVNDGSTDTSPQTVRSMNDARVRMIDGPQRGISASVNAGLAVARGAFVARCDADDLFPLDRLARQAAWLNARPVYGAVCGYYRTVDQAARPVAEHAATDAREDITDELKSGVGRSHMGAYLFRTETLRQIGGCREWFKTSEDADVQFRLAGVTRVSYDAACAYIYRLHDASITHAVPDARRIFFEQCAKNFARQRLETGSDDLQRGTPPLVPETATTASGRDSAGQIQKLLIGQAWTLHRAGRRGAAVKIGLRAVTRRPMNGEAWKSLLALAFKRE